MIFLVRIGSKELDNAIDLASLLKRPEVKYKELVELFPAERELTEDIREQVEIQIKYEGYIRKQLQDVERMKKMEKKRIPAGIDFDQIQAIAKEARDKLSKIQPLNIGQAARISGVTPADISMLLVYIEHKMKVTQ